MDGGRLIEHETHDVSLDGKYKQMYIAQSRGYFENAG